jgi:hypothetical protein
MSKSFREPKLDRNAKILRSRHLQCERLESREMFAVTYHGGALLEHVETQAVYLGSDWNSNSNLKSQTQQLDQYLDYLVQSPYMDMLASAGYGVSRGSSSAGHAIDLNLANHSSLTDSQIRSQLQDAIASSQLQQPDSNRLYLVYVEPSVLIRDGNSSSVNSFLGYHGAFSGRDASGLAVNIRYAVMAYPGSPNPSSTSQGFATPFQQLTSVTSHELAEAVTDPDANYGQTSWYDDQNNGEIGDLTSQTVMLNGYLVQDVVNKNDRIIEPVAVTTPSPVHNPTQTPSPSVNAPQNIVGSALSATKAHLAWGGVSGVEGYRIYLVNGASTTLLGTVGASQTSVDVVGLQSGSTPSFMIQSFAGNATANSALVSVPLATTSPTPISLPSPNHTLATPVVTGTALSANEIQLNWNRVEGASGYRIYRVIGDQRINVGTVDGRLSSINITGIQSGSTSSWIVQAFNANQTSNSNIASVSTPVVRRPNWWSMFFG